MKKLVKLITIVITLLIILVAIPILSIDIIAKTAIEQGSEFALGVEVTLGSADVGIISGDFALQDLKIANPDGFQSPHFLHLQSGLTQVTLSSLSEDTVILPMLTLTGIDMHIEKNSDKYNYDEIFNNLARFNSQDKPQKTDGKKFIIREVVLKDIIVHVEVDLLTGKTNLDLPIDELILENVGSDSEGGVLLSELTSVLMEKLMLEIVKRGDGLLPVDLLDDLGQSLSQIESITEMGIDVVIDVTEGVGNILKDVGKGIGDLLGGDK